LRAWEESRWNLIVDDNLRLAEMSPRFSSSTVTRRNLPAAPAAFSEGARGRARYGRGGFRLPGVSGAVFLKQLLAARTRVRAMVISAYTDDGTINEATAAGARFMPKPLDFVRLTRWVGEASS
jgi:DNA-binding NarL/FixJ family response regulator